MLASALKWRVIALGDSDDAPKVACQCQFEKVRVDVLKR
jgi:hypothetical protein